MERSITLTPVEDDTRIPDAVATLERHLDAYGLNVGHDALEVAVKHLLYVMQVNEYINLTRIVDFDSALLLHIFDSYLYLSLLPVETVRLLDMGTGAGFPGIPLAAYLGCEAVLLDSVGKKVSAVNAFCGALGLEKVSGIHDRLESYASAHKGSFDFVTARALAPIGMLLEYARPLLKVGGSLVISKGNLEDDERIVADSVCKQLGFKLADSKSLVLPDDMGHRELLRYEVTRPSSLKLPRAVGMAKKNPLA